jgi:hypothetical protein
MKRSLAPLLVASALVLTACAPRNPVTQPPAAAADPPPAKPAAPALPAAQDILAAAVEAAGGAAAHDALDSYYSEWRMEIPSQGIAADSKLWWKAGKFYTEIDMPGVGRSRMWCDGTTVTSEDRFSGRRVLEGVEAAQARWATSVSLPRDWQQHFETATTKGRREVDGKKLIDVLLTGTDGVELTLTFDETTHLLHSQAFVQQSQMGAMPIEIAMIEYKPFAGIQQAVRTETRLALFTAVTTIGKFEANVAIDDGKFVPGTDPPPATTQPTTEEAKPDAKPAPKTKPKAKPKADPAK